MEDILFALGVVIFLAGLVAVLPLGIAALIAGPVLVGVGHLVHRAKEPIG